jgi:ABC-type multidrug transport system fused ATPase/permease subunit
MEALVHAAELAGAHEFVRSLPNGYHTPLGQRGARLSQGQAQRIAIARAFLKDAPLLILDEPTSALDPESERLVRRSLEVLQRHRTVLVVAHRLNTVCTSDQVVVLQHGVIVERGTHAELIERAGLYAALVGASARMTVAA